jgi:hypothetical protein
MHYHIFWGLKTADEPFILNFSDKQEAIDKFISLVKDVEGESAKDGPPPWDEKKFDDNTYVFRILSENYKYMLVFCKNVCDHKEHTNPLMVN